MIVLFETGGHRAGSDPKYSTGPNRGLNIQAYFHPFVPFRLYELRVTGLRFGFCGYHLKLGRKKKIMMRKRSHVYIVSLV